MAKNKYLAFSVLQTWLSSLERQGRSRNTVEAYQRAITHFIKWYELNIGATFKVDEIVPNHVQAWRISQDNENAAVASVNQRLVAVARFFQWAKSQKLCHENPAENQKSEVIVADGPQGLRTNEIRELLQSAQKNVRDFAIIETLIETGLSVCELLALRVGDIELDEKTPKLTVRQGKHGGYREIPLSTNARIALLRYLDEKHPNPQEKDASLWLGSRGSLKHRSSIMRILRKYAASGCLSEISPNVLRHTFAIRYLSANPGDLGGLAQLLGYRNLNAVQIYSESYTNDLTARIKRVESLV